MKKKRFIEYSYWAFPVMILITLILTFSAKNNFTADYKNQIGLVSNDTIAKHDVVAYLNQELIEPFKKLRVLHLNGAPNECFDHQLIFNYNYEEEIALPFYRDQMVSARVVETDCENKHHLYEIKVWYDDNKIEVRKSIDDEWVAVADFLRTYNKQITKK